MEKIKTKKFSIERSIEWLPNILKRIKKFHPLASKFEINYRNKKVKLYYKIKIPTGKKRGEIGKIFLLKTIAYQIVDFIDESFRNLMKFIDYSPYDNAYIINLNKLPKSDNFLIIFEGDVDLTFLNQIIRLQPAINRDDTKTQDKYWLDVMIRDIESLEKMYSSLDVNEVNSTVQVAVERYFATELPISLKRSINALNTFMRAAKGGDRARLFRTWYQYRKASHHVDKEELEHYFKDLSKSIFLKQYIDIDSPFYIGEVGSHKIENIIPKSFSVEAMANLSLRKPAASGYLIFNKKEYQEKVKKEINNRWGSENSNH